MSADWVVRFPSQVYSRITGDFSSKILSDNKMDKLKNFSSESLSEIPTVFPFVQFTTLPASETGRDLEGTSINGGLFTFQIDVYDNAREQTAKTVMGEVMRIMKDMRFEIIAMPSFDNTDKVKRNTARFRRMVGALDVL